MKIGPFSFSLAWHRVMKNMTGRPGDAKPYGIFRNRHDVRPGRWGFYWYGFEFGSRNPGNKFGTFLKRIGLWPW